LAGGLDRSHSQHVKDVTLQPSSVSDSNELELLVHADYDPEVDLWGARRRTKLFKKVFGNKLIVEWAEREKSASEIPVDGQHSAGKNSKAARSSNGSHRNGATTNGAKSRNGRSKKSSPRSHGQER
jgi:hypothetical protein